MPSRTTFLGILLVAAMGCAVLEQRPPAETAPPASWSASAVPVNPEGITAANAKTKLQLLQEELDREAEALDQVTPIQPDELP